MGRLFRYISTITAEMRGGIFQKSGEHKGLVVFFHFFFSREVIGETFICDMIPFFEGIKICHFLKA